MSGSGRDSGLEETVRNEAQRPKRHGKKHPTHHPRELTPRGALSVPLKSRKQRESSEQRQQILGILLKIPCEFERPCGRKVWSH